MKVKFILVIIIVIILISDCRKNNSITNIHEEIEWMHVFPDIEILNANLNKLSGRNAKIITDNEGNIYLFHINYSNSNNTTFLTKFTSDGKQIWERGFNYNFDPLDILKMNDGKIAILFYKFGAGGFGLYKFSDSSIVDSILIQTGILGLGEIYYSSMDVMPDNSIIISASSVLNNGIYNLSNFFVKISPTFKMEWQKQYDTLLGKYPLQWEENSIIAANNKQCVFQYAIGTSNQGKPDSTLHGLVTGIINDDGSIDTCYFKQTGYSVSSSGKQDGVNYNFVRGLISDGSGGFIYHFSNPKILNNIKPAISSGFLKINSRGKVTDTIPIDLLDGYQITAFAYSNEKFLLTAQSLYNVDAILMTGGKDFKATKTIILNNSYKTFLSSVTPAKDGGFIIAGKIFSFGGAISKLILMKWK